MSGKDPFNDNDAWEEMIMEGVEMPGLVEIEDIGQLKQALGVDKTYPKSMPGTKTREDKQVRRILGQDAKGKVKINAMLALFVVIVELVAAIICPGDPVFLLELLAHKLGATYCNSFDDRDLQERVSKTVMWSLFEACTLHHFTLIMHRLCRSILVNACTQTVLQTAFSTFDPPKFGKDARRTGRNDYKTVFEVGTDLKKTIQSVSRVSDEWIEDAVKDISGQHNVKLLSWGTQDLFVPGTGEQVTVPRLIRKRLMKDMWRNYQQRKKLAHQTEASVNTRSVSRKKDHVGRSTYLKLAAELTAGGERLIRSVDYTVDILVNEPVQTLQEIISLAAPSIPRDLTHELLLVQNFLKH